MSKVHYLVRRSRSGRFNFTLLSEAGRITGSVVVATTGKTPADIERDAHDQIRRLSETFAEIASPSNRDVGDTSSTKCKRAASHPVNITP